jgi:hypothetical protein
VLNQRVNGELAPISFYSTLLSSAERRYSTYDKDCLAVFFGRGQCSTYLEHKQFELQCDNLALCWLLARVKDVGRLGRWIMRRAPFKFRVNHTHGEGNVVADALSRMFEGQETTEQESGFIALLKSLPLFILLLEDTRSRIPSVWFS